MEKQLSALDAWADYWTWIRQQPKWADIGRRQKQYMYRAEKDFREGKLGYERIKNILTTYAPGRYTFTEIVTVNE